MISLLVELLYFFVIVKEPVLAVLKCIFDISWLKIISVVEHYRVGKDLRLGFRNWCLLDATILIGSFQIQLFSGFTFGSNVCKNSTVHPSGESRKIIIASKKIQNLMIHPFWLDRSAMKIRFQTINLIF